MSTQGLLGLPTREKLKPHFCEARFNIVVLWLPRRCTNRNQAAKQSERSLSILRNQQLSPFSLPVQQPRFVELHISDFTPQFFLGLKRIDTLVPPARKLVRVWLQNLRVRSIDTLCDIIVPREKGRHTLSWEPGTNLRVKVSPESLKQDNTRRENNPRHLCQKLPFQTVRGCRAYFSLLVPVNQQMLRPRTGRCRGSFLQLCDHKTCHTCSHH